MIVPWHVEGILVVEENIFDLEEDASSVDVNALPLTRKRTPLAWTREQTWHREISLTQRREL